MTPPPMRRPRGRPREDKADIKPNQSLEKALGLLKSLSDHDGLTPLAVELVESLKSGASA